MAFNFRCAVKPPKTLETVISAKKLLEQANISGESFAVVKVLVKVDANTTQQSTEREEKGEKQDLILMPAQEDKL